VATVMDRRDFLRRGAATAGGLTVAPALQGLLSRAEASPAGNRVGLLAPNNGGYGPLVTDPNGVLSLPAGFSYVRFGETGSPMNDGVSTPGAHDGMAVFEGPAHNLVRLVRNHEQSGAAPFALPAYDPLAAGGTTNLVYDTAARELVGSYSSLSGTVRNCAGGPTPWDSWLTCEEDFSMRQKAHGYIFDVPADATSPVDPVPLTDMGRFVHEAIAVDPKWHRLRDRGPRLVRLLPLRSHRPPGPPGGRNAADARDQGQAGLRHAHWAEGWQASRG
jgi:secreted PhoX family phosphatase